MFKKIVQSPVYFYRMVISPWLAPTCRFSPSCSSYALEAIDKHGAFKGSALALWRILRCNPFNHNCGYDPVPKNKKTRH